MKAKDRRLVFVAAGLVCLIAFSNCGRQSPPPHTQRMGGQAALGFPDPVTVPFPRPAHPKTYSAEQAGESYLAAVASQSDPARLATLGVRGANPRVKRIVYWLSVARTQGRDPGEVIDQAQRINGSAGTPRAPLVRAALLRNLKIADGLGLLTPENQELMRRGHAPRVTRGPYTGQPIEVDHIVPCSIAPETGNELANLEMLPRSLNRRKRAKVGDRQLAVAKQMREAALISTDTMARVEAAFRPAATNSVELSE